MPVLFIVCVYVCCLLHVVVCVVHAVHAVLVVCVVCVVHT